MHQDLPCSIEIAVPLSDPFNPDCRIDAVLVALRIRFLLLYHKLKTKEKTKEPADRTIVAKGKWRRYLIGSGLHN